jgi:hypothetical protein
MNVHGEFGRRIGGGGVLALTLRDVALAELLKNDAVANVKAPR